MSLCVMHMHNARCKKCLIVYHCLCFGFGCNIVKNIHLRSTHNPEDELCSNAEQGSNSLGPRPYLHLPLTSILFIWTRYPVNEVACERCKCNAHSGDTFIHEITPQVVNATPPPLPDSVRSHS